MTTPAEPEWVELETVHKLHFLHLAEHGGIPGLRDEGLLLSALSRPLQKWTFGDPPPDICSLAAAYAYGIARNHPFLDGNKRTAAVVCEVFLFLNNRQPTADEDEKYPVYLGLASGEIGEDDFAIWLRSNSVTIS